MIELLLMLLTTPNLILVNLSKYVKKKTFICHTEKP